MSSTNRLTYVKTFRKRNNKKYYNIVKYPIIPLTINDIYITTIIGDRLDSLAYQFYKDVDLWWIISRANMSIVKRDSFSLKPGIEIRMEMKISN